ncbi:large conductance mechanosensitive channel protein MscL [Bacillus alkalicellulosilyticus]|uniref:large conductance mechanosensitive channel protein MscL n=1 Tax=Alkalihalobacterium alkalicellulosilyticum TaxID=1912214 RepID=UPI0009989C88|nr:large conductance mechanosensitive channel protein MscL [Bacillus alkalicellulosilyticus]
MMEEFKEFAMRGNVVDMSIGVIIGTTFAKIVQSFVDDVLMPPIGLLVGQVDFSNLYINLSNETFETLQDAREAGAPTLNYGIFLNHIIHFMIVAFVLFMFVRQMNRIRRPDENLLDSIKTKTCSFCFSVIPYKASRCPKCTSDLTRKTKETPSSRKKEHAVIRFKGR